MHNATYNLIKLEQVVACGDYPLVLSDKLLLDGIDLLCAKAADGGRPDSFYFSGMIFFK